MAENCELEWLGPEVPRNNVKTSWKCPKGHKWETTYACIQDGKGCPVCGIEKRAEKRRLKVADYHTLAKKRDFIWLGPEVANNSVKTWWECRKEHRWEACYGSIQQERGCPICANKTPKTVKDYLDLAEERGFKWMGEELPEIVVIKTRWKCVGGHEWEAHYNNIQQGKGCPYCAGNIPKTPRDYHNLARTNDFKWIGKKFPENIATKTLWRCLEGHEWETTYASIQENGCPYCSGVAKKAIEDYHGLAEERGFKWIGEELPRGVRIKTKWECKQGHQWETPYNHIQQGTGCPHCAGLAKKVIEDYYSLASERGFEWIGEELPEYVAIKTPWRCPQKHEWEACYSSIQQGSGCPHCLDLINGVQVSKPQRQICKMVGGKLNYPCDSYNIDIALPKKRIAIEYDSWFWHGCKLEKDAERDTNLLTAGWKVLHIKSNKKIPSKCRLDEAIDKLMNGMKKVEIVLDDWEEGPTFADVKEQEKVDPWEKGPIPISWDGGTTFIECQQLNLW